jgi:hypothetical protein
MSFGSRVRVGGFQVAVSPSLGSKSRSRVGCVICGIYVCVRAGSSCGRGTGGRETREARAKNDSGSNQWLFVACSIQCLWFPLSPSQPVATLQVFTSLVYRLGVWIHLVWSIFESISNCCIFPAERSLDTFIFSTTVGGYDGLRGSRSGVIW